ncbi:MAG: hypothetical protein IPM88_05920 [Nitrospira sp.]|nr:hypothetical protein [Nitrospira sp.]
MSDGNHTLSYCCHVIAPLIEIPTCLPHIDTGNPDTLEIGLAVAARQYTFRMSPATSAIAFLTVSVFSGSVAGERRTVMVVSSPFQLDGQTARRTQ